MVVLDTDSSFVIVWRSKLWGGGVWGEGECFSFASFLQGLLFGEARGGGGGAGGKVKCFTVTPV